MNEQVKKASEDFIAPRVYKEGNGNKHELYCALSDRFSENKPHWHHYYELEVTLTGTGTEIINSSMYPMRRGEAHIIYPADIHTFQYDKNLKFCYIQFEKMHISNEMYLMLEGIKLDPVVYFPPEVCTVIEQIYNSIETINNNLEVYDPTLIKIKERFLEAALTLFLEYKAKNKDSNQVSYISMPIQKVIHYIMNNYQSDISTESVAKHFNYNTAYFRRYFKKHFNMSPKDYINLLRLRHAANILITTDLRVTDVCYNCGYTSMASFQRNFKEQYDMTPLEFRTKYSK